jgi:hypothetical protein
MLKRRGVAGRLLTAEMRRTIMKPSTKDRIEGQIEKIFEK